MSRIRIPRIPSLDNGVNLVKTGEGTNNAFQALAVNHLIRFGEEAHWIDVGNNCSTHLLSRISPTPKILEKIQVARAFTPYQHYSLIEKIKEAATPETNLIVLPLIDHLYRKDVRNRKWRGEFMEDVVKNIEKVTDDLEVPALITCEKSLAEQFENPTEILCSSTGHGLKFETDGFKTLTYRGPGYIQTTLKLWELILKEEFRSIQRQKVVKERVVRAG